MKKRLSEILKIQSDTSSPDIINPRHRQSFVLRPPGVIRNIDVNVERVDASAKATNEDQGSLAGARFQASAPGIQLSERCGEEALSSERALHRSSPSRRSESSSLQGSNQWSIRDLFLEILLNKSKVDLQRFFMKQSNLDLSGEEFSFFLTNFMVLLRVTLLLFHFVSIIQNIVFQQRWSLTVLTDLNESALQLTPLLLYTRWILWLLNSGLFVHSFVKQTVQTLPVILVSSLLLEMGTLALTWTIKALVEEIRLIVFMQLNYIKLFITILLGGAIFPSKWRHLLFLICSFSISQSNTTLVHGLAKYPSLKEDSSGLLASWIFNFLMLSTLWWVLSLIKLHFLISIKQKWMKQNQLMGVMDNLDTAIITVKQEAGLDYCNNLGGRLLSLISRMPGLEEPPDKKIFKLVKQNQQGSVLQQDSSDTHRSESSQKDLFFSLSDLFEMESKGLENKVFSLDAGGSGGMDLPTPRVDLLMDPAQETARTEKFKFVQIKKKQQIDIEDDHLQIVLQVIDISDQIMFELQSAERKLLVLINATVSHEMRNPINSIQCQALNQSQLNEQIEDLLEPSVDLPTIRKRLTDIHSEYCESTRIQQSSTKILKFLVSDILDFSQLRSGKFRKDISQFNVREAIDEIFLILHFKARQVGVNLEASFQNFGTGEGEDSLEVCSDQHRLQQIMMNLVSNAIKFTPKGGTIEVKAKLIRSTFDCDARDLGSSRYANQFYDLAGQAQHGMLQIQVTDTGVGIQKEDQAKLFKLFGFLDSTRELNTKGIGLGLHISKQISEQFGGNIFCKSKWGEGTTFTFLFALNEMEAGQATVRRYLNPLKTSYPKFSIRPLDFEMEHSLSEIDIKSNPPEKIIFSSMTDGRHLNVSSVLGQEDFGSIARLPDQLNNPFAQAPIEACAVSRQVVNLSVTPFQRREPPAKKKSSYVLPKFSLHSHNKSGSLPRKRILIVDDEPYNIIGLQIILTQALFKVFDITDSEKRAEAKGWLESNIDQALNGQEAVDLVRKSLVSPTTYGLILMDCSMPIKDGYKATEEIRAMYRRSPTGEQPMIIACTGHTEEEYIKKAFRYKMDEVMPKPANFEVVSAVVLDLLDLS